MNSEDLDDIIFVFFGDSGFRMADSSRDSLYAPRRFE